MKRNTVHDANSEAYVDYGIQKFSPAIVSNVVILLLCHEFDGKKYRLGETKCSDQTLH